MFAIQCFRLGQTYTFKPCGSKKVQGSLWTLGGSKIVMFISGALRGESAV